MPEGAAKALGQIGDVRAVEPLLNIIVELNIIGKTPITSSTCIAATDVLAAIAKIDHKRFIKQPVILLENRDVPK